MNVELHARLMRLKAFILCGLLCISFGAFADEETVSGAITFIRVSGNAGLNIINDPYTGATGEPFALIEVGVLSAANMPIMTVMDSAVERAMLLGLISNLVTGQGATLTGEVETNCAGPTMDPITSVAFN